MDGGPDPPRGNPAGTIDIIDSKPKRRSKGRIDYTLRIKVLPKTRLVRWLGIARSKYHDWRERYGQVRDASGRAGWWRGP